MIRVFRNITLVFLTILGLSVFAQAPKQNPAVLAYIDKYKQWAMEEMILYKIPASITLAQAIVESGHGTGRLAVQGHNHFCIKCPGRVPWTGKTMKHNDDAPNECFRVYENDWQSFRDHSLFLHQNSIYASLFDLKITDYVGWAKGLKKAGWATNPAYPSLLIDRIKVYDLTQYDKMVMKGKVKVQKGHEAGPLVFGKKTEVKDKDKNKPAPEPTPEPKVKTQKKSKGAVNTKPVPVFSECPVLAMTPDHHYIRENFGVKFIITKNGDDIDKIAKELKISKRQLRKYNNFSKAKKSFSEGEILYIGPKRHRAAAGYKVHVIKQGETLTKVSQLYAVKLERLFKMNGLDENSILQVGQEIRLR